MVEMQYCKWIDMPAPLSEFPQACKDSAIAGICTKCETSPQLKLGMKPSDLLRNIRE
jgi:hypothetical protein